MVGNKSHGGKREGAGRKPGRLAFKKVAKKEATKVRRIPVSLVEFVDKLIEDYKLNDNL